MEIYYKRFKYIMKFVSIELIHSLISTSKRTYPKQDVHLKFLCNFPEFRKTIRQFLVCVSMYVCGGYSISILYRKFLGFNKIG